MRLVNMLGAAALAVTVPVAASAVPLDISDNIDDALRTSYNIFEGDTAFFYNERILPEDSDGNEQALFSFTNQSNIGIRLRAGLDASVNPEGSQNPEPVFFFDDNAPTGLDESTILSRFVGVGETLDFSVLFGKVTDPDFSQVDVAFRVEPVPVPAGLVLLGTALGGLGIARRYRKA